MGRPPLELAPGLVEIERLNAKANWLLIDGHLGRGLTIPLGAQQGNYKVHGSPSERKIRDQLLLESYLAMRKHRKMSKRSARIAVGRERGTSESTVKRTLKRLGITD